MEFVPKAAHLSARRDRGLNHKTQRLAPSCLAFAEINVPPPPIRRRTFVAWMRYGVAMHGDGLVIPGVACAISLTSHVAGNSGQADLSWSMAVAVSTLLAGRSAPWGWVDREQWLLQLEANHCRREL